MLERRLDGSKSIGRTLMRRTTNRKRKVGRPSKYDLVELQDVTDLALLGMTEEQIANTLEVSVESIHNWKRQYPEFLQALNRGRGKADGRVARSLYERALGYSHKELKLFYNKDNDEVIEHEVTKYYPPETVAAIFWLKNRQRALWRDVRNNEVSGPNGAPISTEIIPVKTLEPEDRAKLRAFLEQTVTDVVDQNEQGDTDGEDEADESERGERD